MARFRQMIPTLFASFAVLAAACGWAGDGARVEPPAEPEAAAACAPVRPHEPGSSARSLQSGGADRSYLLHVPAAYDGERPLPLVVAFHGLTMDADFFAGYNGFDALAEREAFIIVTPQGTGEPPAWDARGLADITFAQDLIAGLTASLCIDAGRIYVAGYSNGGAMAQEVACAMPDDVAAVALVAATYVPCRANVPLIAFHGVDDPIVPFEGSERSAAAAGVFPSVRRSVSEWAKHAGCDGLAAISRPSGGVELSTFKRCFRGDGEVLLYAIVGGGHTWPGAATPLDAVGATTGEIDATETIWAFFQERAVEPRSDASTPAAEE